MSANDRRDGDFRARRFPKIVRPKLNWSLFWKQVVNFVVLSQLGRSLLRLFNFITGIKLLYENFRLGELAKELNESNYNVSFVIVNHFEKESVGRGDVFAQSQLPVLQDIQKLNVWNLYKVDTDDMLIFDEWVYLFILILDF